MVTLAGLRELCSFRQKANPASSLHHLVTLPFPSTPTQSGSWVLAASSHCLLCGLLGLSFSLLRPKSHFSFTYFLSPSGQGTVFQFQTGCFGLSLALLFRYSSMRQSKPPNIAAKAAPLTYNVVRHQRIIALAPSRMPGSFATRRGWHSCSSDRPGR